MNNNILTKDTILNNISAEKIYLKFLQLSDFPRNNISSPFSKDKNPSFKLYSNGTFKCYSTRKHGDVFQFVADLKQLDCKTQFNEVLKTIASEMNIALQDNCNNVRNPIASNEKQTKLSVETRSFTSLDLQYWKNLGITKETLTQYNVHSIVSYNWSGKNPIYTKKESVAFAFELQGNFKLYIPNQPEAGIKKNVLPPFPSGIFGLKQIGNKKVENLIICAGEKDTITASSRGFNAITFGSETSNPTKEQIEKLQAVCKNLFVCFDNDIAGEKGRNELTKRFPSIIPLQLPQNNDIKGYDITDYFQDYTADDFQEIIDLAVKEKKLVFKDSNNTEKEIPTIFHIAEEYLQSKYDFRYNEILLEIEMKKKEEDNWIPCNENSLWLEMQKKNIKIPLNSLIAILKSDVVEKFNPIVSYFENLHEWDKTTDYIKQFSEYVILDNESEREQFEYHLKKWCVRTVKCATINGYFNKQAFVLTDDGKGQNIGKSSWCRFLCPDDLKNYIAEDIGNDKDSRLLLCKNFLVNLDELAVLSKKEINHLKSFFSKEQINERLPYDRKNSIIPRIASFIGSTNMSTFLQDETGSVRWLCFVVKSINWNYKNDFIIDNLWSQAYQLSKDKTFVAELTREDVEKNEERNDKFQVLSPEVELLQKHFKVPGVFDEKEFMTSTDVMNYITSQPFCNVRLSNIAMGKALQKKGFIRTKHNQVYGYWVEKIVINY